MGLEIETSDFTVFLADGWTERANQEAREYVSADEKEQLLLSVSRAKKTLSATEMKKAVEELAAARQRVVAQISQGFGQLLPVRQGSSSESASMSLVGTDAGHGVLLYVRVIANAHRVVTASYNGYFDRPPDNEDVAGFSARAEPVCESLRVNDVAPPRRGWWPWF